MKTLRGIFLFFVAFLVVGMTSGYAWAGTMPSSVSLVGQPYSVSWPDSSGFTAQLKVESGPEGADFGFGPVPTYWGVEGATGFAFLDGKATLDGPGELTTGVVGVPSVGAGFCIRGSGWAPDYNYELTLPPNSSTVVEIPTSLNASPLEGMNSTLSFKYFVNNGSLAPRVEAPVEISGTKGVVVKFGIGDETTQSAEVWNRKPIRLAGTTSPALPNTEIRIKAEPFAAPLGTDPPPRWISLVTDSTGGFISKKLRFGRSAFWRLTAHPQVGPSYGSEPTCGPVLQTQNDSWRTNYSDLTNHTFQSTSVKSTKLADQTKIRLSFEASLIDHDGDPKTPSRWIYKLIGNAGCNTLAGRYWLKNGHLVWSRKLTSTKKSCRKPVDRWLKRTLRKGVAARMVKGKLVLRGSRGIRIVLVPTDS